jgi:CubicO group peptidase (beta-lactamase class C family)
MNKLPWAEEFAALVGETMTTYEEPGTAVAFAENGRLVYAQGFGSADREAGIAVTPEQIFGIASITKSFTCLSIMQLAESGKLAVNDPIIRYLPEFRLPDERATQTATIGHLMSHTAGLPPLSLLLRALAPSQKGDPVMEEFADRPRALHAMTPRPECSGSAQIVTLRYSDFPRPVRSLQ